MKFSIETETLLKNFGWYAGRNIDITQYLEYYKKEGLKINEVIKDFLQEYGGIKIIYPHHKYENLTHDMEINPLESAPYKNDTREYYELRTGEYLVPIGNAMGRHMYVFMSFSGSIYITDSDYMMKLGDSYINSLETICKGNMGEEIEDIYDDEEE